MKNSTEKEQDEILLQQEINAIREIISLKESDKIHDYQHFLQSTIYTENKFYEKYEEESQEDLEKHLNRLEQDLEDLRGWF